MDLRELVDTLDLPDTRVADEAWDRAHTRLLRRRGLVAGGVGLVVAGVLVGVSAITPESGQRVPTPMTGSADPTPGSGHLPVVVVQPDWTDLGSAPSLAPPADAPGLSSDPVAHAALVMGDPEDQAAAYVLGDDGGWRRLDVPGLEPISDGANTSSIIVPTAVDPTGTRLAIPQPQALVVVDLTTGDFRRYDVPGFLHYAVWLDGDTVGVAPESAHQLKAVGLTSGAVKNAGLDPATRVLNDGSRLVWPSGASTFTWYLGTSGPNVGTSAVNNAGGFFWTSPLLRDGRGVVINSGTSLSNPAPTYPPAELQGTVGIAAVDLASGDPVGYVQLSGQLESKGTASVLLGWRGDDPVLALQADTVSSLRLFVAAWDVDAGTLEPIATLPTYWVSWGVGL